VPAFVFRFGYESLQQQAATARGRWDDESSQWVVIDDPDAAADADFNRVVPPCTGRPPSPSATC
jgi:hypothetical protein